jgi:hypothetical protein
MYLKNEVLFFMYYCLISSLAMNKLAMPLLQLIQNFGSTEDQMALMKTGKRCNTLELTAITCGYPNDDIIMKYRRTLRLITVVHNLGTDKSIKHLTHLHTLYADFCKKITDESIYCLRDNLRVLHTIYNSSITDDSVRCLINL